MYFCIWVSVSQPMCLAQCGLHCDACVALRGNAGVEGGWDSLRISWRSDQLMTSGWKGTRVLGSCEKWTVWWNPRGLRETRGREESRTVVVEIAKRHRLIGGLKEEHRGIPFPVRSSDFFFFYVSSYAGGRGLICLNGFAKDIKDWRFHAETKGVGGLGLRLHGPHCIC